MQKKRKKVLQKRGRGESARVGQGRRKRKLRLLQSRSLKKSQKKKKNLSLQSKQLKKNQKKKRTISKNLYTEI